MDDEKKVENEEAKETPQEVIDVHEKSAAGGEE